VTFTQTVPSPLTRGFFVVDWSMYEFKYERASSCGALMQIAENEHENGWQVVNFIKDDVGLATSYVVFLKREKRGRN
jgi:hypothetical protein